MFGDAIGTSVTYHPISVVGSFLAFLHLLAHVRNNGLDVCNDGVDVFNIVMNIRNEGVGLRDGYVCVYCKFSLGKNI